VLAELARAVGSFSTVSFVEIHAGADYWNFGLAEGLVAAGAAVEIPTRGMDPGHQRAFYRDASTKRLATAPTVVAGTMRQLSPLASGDRASVKSIRWSDTRWGLGQTARNQSELDSWLSELVHYDDGYDEDWVSHSLYLEGGEFVLNGRQLRRLGVKPVGRPARQVLAVSRGCGCSASGADSGQPKIRQKAK
jgi:hypothetical protein